jgi:hypothetical protein
MSQYSAGVVSVVTPGTPVRASINFPDPNLNVTCQSILFQVLSNGTHTNTGRVYILDQNRARVGTLAIPTSNTIPAYSVTIPNSTGALDVGKYYIDADNATDGVDVSYVRP